MRLLARIAAVLCLLAFLPWALGVPGVEGSDYACGWTIGFWSIILFPVAVVLLEAAPLMLRLAGKTWQPQRAIHGVALALFAAAQAFAWSLILA